MIFTETKLDGAYIIDIEKRQDERGFFARSWCIKEVELHGLDAQCIQANISNSANRGTLRGMHYQIAPFREAKLVRCTRGGIFDVIIDLRTDSATYTDWMGVELTAKNYRMLYVPEGFAHGFLTLENDTEVTYQVSQFYHPESERGVRYNDPVFAIEWPREVLVISEKDNSWPGYVPNGASCHSQSGMVQETRS
jgi:dTDP-4-dehydrorhamnose 3,5-epimerase